VMRPRVEISVVVRLNIGSGKRVLVSHSGFVVLLRLSSKLRMDCILRAASGYLRELV
jgi:hypothetical protein